MLRDLSHIRNDFVKQALTDAELQGHPVELFQQWLNNAIDNNCPEPTAMTLSTISPDGFPSGRIVLLKHVSVKEGFWFYTNYKSIKGQHLANNPNASLNFFWPQLERQVRISGTSEKLSPQQNDNYFNSRPIDSKIGASISPQSQVIESRKQLESWYNQAKENTFKIARPEHWGGYAIKPISIEFWQGRAGRLHDRIRFKLENGTWQKDRLAP